VGQCPFHQHQYQQNQQSKIDNITVNAAPTTVISACAAPAAMLHAAAVPVMTAAGPSVVSFFFFFPRPLLSLV